MSPIPSGGDINKLLILFIINLLSRLLIFAFLCSWGFSQQFIFVDCRTGLCKNNIKCVYMDIFAAIYFREFVFLVNIAKINRS